MTQQFIMSHQQPTRYSLNLPVRNPPSDPVRGLANAPSETVMGISPLLEHQHPLRALPRHQWHRSRHLLTPISPRLKLPTPPLRLKPRQMLQALPTRRSHRSRLLQEALEILTLTSPRLELPTPRLVLGPWPLLQPLPKRRSHRSRRLREDL